MRLFVLFHMVFLAINLQIAGAQPPMTVDEYISEYKEIALEEMEKYGIPASITLAQGILESGCGNSTLAKEANNHFGIKCHVGWTGKTFHQDDDEKNECFRKYGTALESYKDHSQFLLTRDRYKFLFDLEITDYKSWAFGLKEAGYATNPRYPEMLIRIIEENGLAEYDKAGGRQSAVGSQEETDEIQNSTFDIQNSPPGAVAPDVFEMAGRGGDDRVIFLNNGSKFILAREGDDFFSIASEFGIYSWQIREYNEFKKTGSIVPGEKIYLEKKRSKSEFDFHSATEGETLRSISQDFGVRLKSLARLNKLDPGTSLEIGQKIRLR